MRIKSDTEPDFLLGVDENGIDAPDHLRCLACGAMIWAPSGDEPIWGKWRGAYYADYKKIEWKLIRAYREHATRCFAMKRLIVLMGKQRV